MEKIGYYINDRFTLDDGTDAGVNVMLFNGPKLDYWFKEHRCNSVEEAENYIKSYNGEMIEINIEHPISNRRYTQNEISEF